MIQIDGLSQGSIIAALYNRAREFYHDAPPLCAMSEKAGFYQYVLFASSPQNYDVRQGLRVERIGSVLLFLWLNNNLLDASGYDMCYGEGQAKQVIDQLRESRVLL